ncbi:SIMPL domain-containing protein [Flagellimonas sp. 389]|uniref:SIMPL domain-containing protein n=1 Tax=Flagellimonas sp. 389 TaxID=2835862 RepID=UPI001BD5FF6F|nr:SIMPL domain-containing protein [Flagellimonas sp. 389]MBS9463744.1 SIMPL domain-containing protein [Flagellimonas sp. 389]
MKQVIAILGLLFFVNCQNGSIVEPSKFKTIMIKSFGEVETPPDMATFHIDLSCLNKSIQTSKKCLVDKSNILHDRLLGFGIEKNDILTTSVAMNKSYTWRNNSNIFEGYRSSTSVFITVRNIEKLSEIYTELLENRNLDLGGLSYSHSKIDSLENAAYVKALEKSKILADRLLQELPESKKEILKIGNVEISGSMLEKNIFQPENEFGMAQQPNVLQEKSIAISKGILKMSATLYAEYQIK